MFTIIILQKVSADSLNINIVPYLNIINTSILYLHPDKENPKKLLQKIILFAKAELMKILKNIY